MINATALGRCARSHQQHLLCFWRRALIGVKTQIVGAASA